MCFKGLVCILCAFVGKGLVYIFVCFCVSSDHFGLVLSVRFIGFGFSVPSQEIGWEERL